MSPQFAASIFFLWLLAVTIGALVRILDLQDTLSDLGQKIFPAVGAILLLPVEFIVSRFPSRRRRRQEVYSMSDSDSDKDDRPLIRLPKFSLSKDDEGALLSGDNVFKGFVFRQQEKRRAASLEAYKNRIDKETETLRSLTSKRRALSDMEMEIGRAGHNPRRLEAESKELDAKIEEQELRLQQAREALRNLREPPPPATAPSSQDRLDRTMAEYESELGRIVSSSLDKKTRIRMVKGEAMKRIAAAEAKGDKNLMNRLKRARDKIIGDINAGER